MKRGMKWCVGNGDSILLWSNKWLPSLASQKILSPTNHILPNDAKVSALIDLEKKKWHEQLVRQVLGVEEANLVLRIPLSMHLPQDLCIWDGNPTNHILPNDAKVSALIELEKKEWLEQLFKQVLEVEEANLVLGIPLSMHLPPDLCIWEGNPKGKFTVRNAYKSLIEGLGSGSEGESFDGMVMKQIWRSIWGMKTPNKIRSFAWKVCQGILPTKENLKRRHVIADDLCETCGKEPENYSHLF